MKPSIRGWRTWGGHDHLDTPFPNPQIQEQRFGHWDMLLGRAQPFLNDKVLSNVGVYLRFMRTPFPTPPNPEVPSQHPKPRNTGRDRRICHWEWFCPFLDNEVPKDREDLGFREVAAPFSTPQIQE